MKKLLIILLLTPLSLFPTGLEDIMEILKIVETNNNPLSIGDEGKAFGVLQIHKICVDDVNRIYGTHYTHEQMFEETCAEEVFYLYLQHGINRYKNMYRGEPPDEYLVRGWNGGIYKGYKKEATLKYYYKYLKILDHETNR